MDLTQWDLMDNGTLRTKGPYGQRDLMNKASHILRGLGAIYTQLLLQPSFFLSFRFSNILAFSPWAIAQLILLHFIYNNLEHIAFNIKELIEKKEKKK